MTLVESPTLFFHTACKTIHSTSAVLNWRLSLLYLP